MIDGRNESYGIVKKLLYIFEASLTIISGLHRGESTATSYHHRERTQKKSLIFYLCPGGGMRAPIEI